MILTHRGRQLFKLLISSLILLSAEARYFITPMSILHVRGGSSTGDPSGFYGTPPVGDNPLYGAPPDVDAPPPSMLHQESYQDRIDAWKTRQQVSIDQIDCLTGYTRPSLTDHFCVTHFSRNNTLVPTPSRHHIRLAMPMAD